MAGSAAGDLHRPVLLDKTVTMLRVAPGRVYVDGTFGLGGHSEAILRRSAPDGRVIAFDVDEEAITRGRARLARYRDRLSVQQRNFRDLDLGLREAGVARVDGILVDIGVSSLQLDGPGRGFSFRRDEPLDMRMDRTLPLTAADIVAEASEEELADIFFYYGEEKQARRIAAEIVAKRKTTPIRTTGELAGVIRRAVPKRFHPKRIDAATRVFQALRIAVNDELASLREMLAKAPGALRVGGRVGVIAFHSLEDRIVKRSFSGSAELGVITKKPLTPDEAEIRDNPRSRSARLRVAERLA